MLDPGGLAINGSEALVVVVVGLIAGLLGGLLGIGGSIVMIPGLAIAFHNAGQHTQHLFQASAMAINFAVAIPAAITHARAGALRKDLLARMLPIATVAIVLGVALSNQLEGGALRRLFALFLLYVAAINILRAIRRTPDHAPEEARFTVLRCSSVGLVMGFTAGLLGIGGGILTIPLIQTICKAPLRQCIGATSAAMCLTAVVGASLRIGTLGQHGFAPQMALILAALLAPTAVAGSWLGARLTHTLPTAVVRAALVIVMLLASWQMWRLAGRGERLERRNPTPAVQSAPSPADQPVDGSPEGA